MENWDFAPHVSRLCFSLFDFVLLDLRVFPSRVHCPCSSCRYSDSVSLWAHRRWILPVRCSFRSCWRWVVLHFWFRSLHRPPVVFLLRCPITKFPTQHFPRRSPSQFSMATLDPKSWASPFSLSRSVFFYCLYRCREQHVSSPVSVARSSPRATRGSGRSPCCSAVFVRSFSFVHQATSLLPQGLEVQATVLFSIAQPAKISVFARASRPSVYHSVFAWG
jgi:hypothetical protein